MGSAPRPSVEPGVVIPGTRYRALRRIDASAGGVVYQVEHVELGRRFALRLLCAELAQRSEVVRRARADWQALGKLRHPHIARVTDAGVTALGVPYCVTELLAGETLQKLLLRRRSLSVPEALALGRELGSALAAAHAIGVVHGNVEPHKIFLTRAGCSKLWGFGSYELDARGVPPDAHADVRGLGLVLFEMIAGRPAHGVCPRRTVRARNSRGCPALAEVVPGVSTALSRVVARLLALEPHTPSTLAAVIAELRALERRYQRQVSTTQETAHYVTHRLPFLVDTASLPTEGACIVPLPSQTLEGIPWTVLTHAPTGRTGGAAPVALPAVVLQQDTRRPSPMREPAAPLPGAAGPSVVLLRPAPAHGVWVRLMLVLCCSLFAGVLVACLARGSAAEEVGQSPSGGGAVQPLRPDVGAGALEACPERTGR
ncbi:MAG TPA: serine/threonine-protein kinase [Polyangiaceae bacterium]|nr:serine/threonine-protein kinase [Polyangiaceae bacterium]